jgi:uncharacterized protein YeaO (DUF488 family)
VAVARVYDDRSPLDGQRILVDRIWPRGLSKAAADLDAWCKTIAPSTELRRWYAHTPARFPNFRARYLAELQEPERAAALERLRSLAHQGDITLLTATKELALSHAAILAEQLRSGGPAPTGTPA